MGKDERAAKIKQIEEETTKELVELMKKIPPSPKKGDVITRRQVAESFARLCGDASEEGVQKQLKLMDWEDALRKRTPTENRYIVAGWLLLLAGCVIGLTANNYLTISGIGGRVVALLGGLCLIVGLWKWKKRIKNSPPPPQV